MKGYGALAFYIDSRPPPKEQNLTDLPNVD